MAVIGFSFTEFSCKREGSSLKGGIEITHNLTLVDAQKTSVTVGGKKNEVLKVDFSFDVVYKGLGKVSIKGDSIYTDTPEIVEESLKTWTKDKKLPQSVNEQVHKFVYSKAIVKALELSDSLNLPAPIPLPKISFSPKKK